MVQRGIRRHGILGRPPVLLRRQNNGPQVQQNSELRSLLRARGDRRTRGPPKPARAQPATVAGRAKGKARAGAGSADILRHVHRRPVGHLSWRERHTRTSRLRQRRTRHRGRDRTDCTAGTRKGVTADGNDSRPARCNFQHSSVRPRCERQVQRKSNNKTASVTRRRTVELGRLRERHIYMQPRCTTIDHRRPRSPPPFLRGNEAPPTKLGTQTTHLTRLHGGNRMVDCRITQGTTRAMGTGLILPGTGPPTQGGPRDGRLGQHRLRSGMPAARRHRTVFLRQMDATGARIAHQREGSPDILLGLSTFRERHPNVLRQHAIHASVRKRTD